MPPLLSRAAVRPALFAALIASAAAASARAAVFAGDSPTVNRFLAGTSDPNPAFLLAGYDVSGVAVNTDFSGNTNNVGGALIAPQYVVFANHAPIGSLTFRGSGGGLFTYTIGSSTRLDTFDPNDGTTTPGDVRVGHLTQAVDSSITPLPIITGDPSQFAGLLINAFSGNNRAGTNLVDGAVINRFGDGDPSPTATVVYDWDTPPYPVDDSTGATEEGLTGGDSGNALVAVVGGRLGLVGNNYGVANILPGTNPKIPEGIYQSSSTLLSYYLPQLQAAAANGITTVAVPEPATAGCVLLFGLALSARRRRR